MSEDRNDNKRRRANDEESVQANEVPSAPAVVSSASADHPVELTMPNLTEIPQLLMDLPNFDEDQTSSALEKLSDLIAANNLNKDAHKQEAAECGAVALVVQAMRKWQHCRNIQNSSCLCLKYLSYKRNEAGVLIVKLGGMESVFDALKIFPDFDLQRWGIGTLANIFHGIFTSMILQNAANLFVNELDGVLLVTKAMKADQANVDTQRSAALLFLNLSSMKELRGELVKQGAVSSVGMALEKHSENEDLQKRAAKFMQLVFSK